MTNPYYNRITDFIPDTSVRSVDLDAELNAVVVGFDLLGEPTKIGNGGLMWGTDSGAADNYVYDNDGTSTLVAGQLISFAPLNSNTGASTVSVNGGTNLAIVRNDGTAVQANDLLGGLPVILIYDLANTRWQIVGSTNTQTLAAFRPSISTQSGTAYTVTAGDENSLINFTNAASTVVTVPNDATEDLPVGYIVHVCQVGAGSLSIAGGVGVTLRYAYSVTARAQNSSISIMKVASNTFHIVGDIG